MRLTRRGRITVALGTVVAFGALLGGGGLLFLRSIGVTGRSDPGRRVEVVVPDGASASDIGTLLEDAGVVRSALGFRLATYLDGGAGDIQAGSYRLRRGLTARAALGALTRGPEIEVVTITFPEGSWLTDFARVVTKDTGLSGDRFLRLARSGRVRSKLRPRSVDTLEGLLWPSTYEVGEDAGVRSLLERLVAESEAQVEEVDLARLRGMGLSPYEAVIVASLIEAEARVPSDRSKIAAVILNRLGAGMPLGIDATVAYAIGERGADLTVSDLAVDSPYNTRKHAGLPPTPIGAPGRASLEAAAAPAAGEWLYFVVSDCDGRHAFSETYDEFLADKAAYRSLEC
ncbi:MAG: endolytic transglycosylase MltG [Actinomycetota bacterium]